MYSGSSGWLGSEVMPLRLSVLRRHWSITQSSAERLPSRYSNRCGVLSRSPVLNVEDVTGDAPEV